MENLTGLYTMFYRKDTNSLQSKNFRFHGSLKEARDRAAKHCEIMKYRLHFVQPLIADLQLEEDYLLGKQPEPAHEASPLVGNSMTQGVQK